MSQPVFSFDIEPPVIADPVDEQPIAVEEPTE